MARGTLFVVATPIGNLEDITLRALRVLREVAVIAAEDTRRTAHLLARHGITTRTTSLHEHNERQKSASLVAKLLAGDSIALVSDAGTPTVSDPGTTLIADALSAGIRVEPIPGPSAILAALTASGLPTDTFTFAGFPPIRSKDRKLWFARARQVGGTLVFFEAPHRIRQTLEELKSYIGDCNIALARELTKAHETLVKGPISAVLAGPFEERGEFTVVADLGQITIAPISKVTSVPSAESISEVTSVPSEGARSPSDDAALLVELGKLTAIRGVTRRQAINRLSRRHHRAPNEIYAAIERAKKSV